MSHLIAITGPRFRPSWADDLRVNCLVCSFGWEWSSESDDPVVIAGIKAVLDQSVAAARDRGLYHPFKYMNYAAEDQGPLGSYGPENVEFMRRVRATYDPDGLFTTLVPGGFKIA